MSTPAVLRSRHGPCVARSGGNRSHSPRDESRPAPRQGTAPAPLLRSSSIHPLRDPAEQRRQTHRTVVRTLARLQQRNHGAVPPCALCVVKDANDSGASPSRSVQKVVNPFGGHLIGKSDCTTLHSKDGFYRFTYRLPVHATHGGNYCGGLVWLSQTKRRPPGATSFDAHGMFSPQPHIKTSGGIHMASAATNIRDDIQLLQKHMRALQSLA